MAMERERERQRRQQTPAAPAEPALEPARDAAELARSAAASADSIAAEPSVIEINIRTTTSRDADVVRLVATPDTPVGELMEEACASLGIRDRQRYVLVANGEVLGDVDRPLGDLVGEAAATALETRLVRKPEAGAHASAGS